MLKILFCIMLMGFIFVILTPLVDGLISKFSDDNLIKKWWRRHICDYEEDYIRRRQETISQGKNYKYWLKIRKAKKK
jgi:hypothetical protein